MTAYRPPTHILLRRRTNYITDKDLIFFEKACDIYLREIADAYGFLPPAATYMGNDAIVPSTEAAGMDFMDDDGNTASSAHHGWLAGFPWSFIGVKEVDEWTVAGAHEAAEYAGNIRLNQWEIGPDDTLWPRELCDMVESDCYSIAVRTFNESRDVLMSNWVLPSFWEIGSKGPWDKMGTLHAPFTIADGGYAVVQRDGNLIATSSRIPRPSSMRSGRVSQIKHAYANGLRFAATTK